ncbi:MAG: DUF924 domain-containing protein [Alphaproteobacteria bacterium]|nr:DUF924 domain-containing protein [Alphaproteobacteria bacterium]
MNEPASARIAAILDFWFERRSPDDYGRFRRAWFEKNPAFDQIVRERFLGDHERACAGTLRSWLETAEGCLALVILLDQFSRNMFRDDPRAFAMDAAALAVASHAVGRGHDAALPPLAASFLYMPYMHSEQIEDHDTCFALMDRLPAGEAFEGYRKAARDHRHIIARFGRFPHRNAVLERETTVEEAAFLKESGSWF